MKTLLATFVLVLAMGSTSYTTANPTSPEIPEIDFFNLCNVLKSFNLTDGDFYKLFCEAPPAAPPPEGPTTCEKHPELPECKPPGPLPEGPCAHRPELCIVPEEF